MQPPNQPTGTTKSPADRQVAPTRPRHLRVALIAMVVPAGLLTGSSA